MHPWSLQLYLKKTLAQVFFCEFCGFFESIFLQNTFGRLLQSISEHRITTKLFNTWPQHDEKHLHTRIRKHLTVGTCVNFFNSSFSEKFCLRVNKVFLFLKIMNTSWNSGFFRTGWDIVVKSKLSPRSGCAGVRQINQIHTKGP